MPKGEHFIKNDPITADKMNKFLQDGQIQQTVGANQTELMSQAAITAQLNLKADKTTMATELGKKADQAAMTTALGLKADKTTMASELAKKADQSAMTTALGLKADKTTMSTELAKKADLAAMTEALDLKADKTTMEIELDKKADQAAVAAALALKADKNGTYPSLTAGNVSSTIAGVAIGNIFEANGSTVKRATSDANGSVISSTYMKNVDPSFTGAMKIGSALTKIQCNSVSPRNNNIGVTGAMITHENGDEGGLLINEDGAYLWNSTDSGNALKIIDEDNWSSATLKKDATFSSGLLLHLDASGNLKIKGKIQPNGGLTLKASDITITANSNLGGATTLQAALDYIANVFGGVQKVEKIVTKNGFNIVP